MSKNINFDLDDPLGDLLSDNSNDSFYNDEKGKVPNKTAVSRNSSLEKKKSNLFGLSNETTNAKDTSIKVGKNLSGGDWLGLTDTHSENKISIIDRPMTSVSIKDMSDKKEARVSVDAQNTIKPAKLSSPDNLDFLDDLGLSDSEPNLANIKPSAKNVSKTSTLDGIFGKPTSSTKALETPLNFKGENSNASTGYSPSVLSAPINKNVRLTSSNSKFDTGKGPAESKPKPLKTESAIELSRPIKKDSSNTSRRQRSNADWLGVFPDDGNDIIDPKDVTKHDVLPDWLNPLQNKISGDEVSKPLDITHQKKEIQSPENILDRNNIISSPGNFNQVFSELTNLSTKPLIIPELLSAGSDLNLVNNSDLEQQSAAICLQQQESQLMVALQLKAQEERLSALNDRQEESRRVQREVVSAHRHQLELILQGQANHRTQLQSVILQHQQRINSHIQSLLRPPSSLGIKGPDANTKNVDEIDVEVNISENVLLDGGTKKISERIQLEQMILNLKENHNRELEMMENSYRHQIELVSESLASVEDRLKAENDKLTNYYVLRIERLEEENVKLSLQADARIKNIQERQSVEREDMEKKHQRDIEILQEQYQTVIKNIRESTAIEQSTVKEATDYSQKLNLLLRDVEKNNEICSSFLNKMESIKSEDFNKKESEIMMKEKQLNYMMTSLEVQRKNLETESQETRSTLKTLEDTLKQQIQALEGEKLSLRHKRMELDADKDLHNHEKEKYKSYFESEKEIWMRNIKHTEERQADMETHITEKIAKLEQEKQDIVNQRKIIDDLRNKNEALKRTLEKELEDIKENKENLSNNQQKLNLAEMALSARSQELEMLTRSALAKHAVAERKMSEANYVQQTYEDKLKRMQEHAISLNAREQEIARDKVTLSRERLMFHNVQKELQGNQCALCKASIIQQNYLNHNLRDAEGFNGLTKVNVNFSNEFLESSVSRDHVFNAESNERRNFNLLAKLNESTSKNVHFDVSDITQYLTDASGVTSQPYLGHKNYVSFDGAEESNDIVEADETRNSERLSSVLQEIVDPRLVLLKMDIENTTRNLSP